MIAVVHAVFRMMSLLLPVAISVALAGLVMPSNAGSATVVMPAGSPTRVGKMLDAIPTSTRIVDLALLVRAMRSNVVNAIAAPRAVSLTAKRATVVLTEPVALAVLATLSNVVSATVAIAAASLTKKVLVPLHLRDDLVVCATPSREESAPAVIPADSPTRWKAPRRTTKCIQNLFSICVLEYFSRGV